MYAQQINIDSLEQIARDGNANEQSLALYELGNYFKYKVPEKSIAYFDRLLNANSPDELKAQANKQLGGIYYRAGNFNTSKEYYLNALNKLSTSPNRRAEAEILYALGGIFFAQGNLALAADNYLKSLRLYESLNDNVGLVNGYAALANLYSRQNRFSQSIEYYLKAISLYEKSSNTMQALVGYEQIGAAYLKMDNSIKAEEYFKKALASYQKLNNQAGIAMSYYQIGLIAHKQKKEQVALAHLNKSIGISRKLNLLQILVPALNAAGVVYTSTNQIKEATKVLNEAVRMAQKAGMKLELEEAYSGLEKIYQLNSDNSKALTFGTLSREIRDSVFNDSALKQLSDLQLRFEAEKKEKQIALMSKEQEIRESEILRITQLNKLFTYGGIAIGLAMLVLVFFFIQNKKFANSLQKQQAILIEQKEKLDQLNTVKDRFFSIISHDLRNNLTSMKLYFDLISHPKYVPTDHTEITQQISGSVENTIDLLENLLVWASSQIKGIPIHIQKLSLHSMVEENMHLLAAAAAQKNIYVSNEVNNSCQVQADMDMIHLVLRNLLSNAIKFTKNNGQIVIGSLAEKNCQTIFVKDNGVGISEENLAHLFDQHLHPTTKGTGNEKGTGLGLMLCKDFIEKNNGKIWVESNKEQGTTFYISLPLVSKMEAESYEVAPHV